MTSNSEHDPNGEQAEIAELLERSRPIPGAAFRSGLKSSLLASGPEPWTARRRARLLVAAYAGCGTVLLAVAAIGVAGAGPLAAS